MALGLRKNGERWGGQEMEITSGFRDGSGGQVVGIDLQAGPPVAEAS